MRTALDILGTAVWRGSHNPLILNWSEEQLVSILKRLKPGLSDQLSTKARFAAAAVARSLVLEWKLSGNPLRYSRSKEYYRQPERYRTGGPYYTYRFVTQSIDALLGVGLIGSETGGDGRQSVAWPTEALMNLVGDLVSAEEPPGLAVRVETIVMRDADKRDIDYCDTPVTLLMRAEVEDLNHHVSQLQLYMDGQPLDAPVLRRVFNRSLGRNGRLYPAGDSYQNFPSQRRLEITVDIDGQTHPMVEIDFATMHITVAYAEAKAPTPPGDHYDISGVDRELVKSAVNSMLNNDDRNTAINAIADDILKDEEKFFKTGLSSLTDTACRNFSRGLVRKIEKKHQAIENYFYSDCGSRFMRRDSDIAIEVMQRMVRRTGRCPLPVHDSFLVADIDREALAEVMAMVAYRHHLPLSLKGSDGSRWGPVQVPNVQSPLPALLPPPPSFLSGGTNP